MISNSDPKTFSGSLLASVLTINSIGTGQLTIRFPENEFGNITGDIQHLNNPDFIASIGKFGFTIRYINSENKTLVEMRHCQANEVMQDGGLNFYTTMEHYVELPIEGDLERTHNMFRRIQQVNSPKQHKHIVFVLGAGASIDSLPAGADLLRKLLQEKPEGEAQRFIADVFKSNWSDDLPFISFNQVLSVIDIALEREEGFSARHTLNDLRGIKKQLITELRQFMIDQTDQTDDNSYVELVRHLKDFYDSGGQISFINLNYDLLLDQALQKVFEIKDINYILPFRHWNNGKPMLQNTIKKEASNNRLINVVKLHGSLDWMICPTCFEPYLFSGNDLQKSLSNRLCSEDHSVLHEFLFPPTKERIEVHSHWISLQHEADRLLRSADKAVFIGFSLSEDDAHFRFKLTKHLYRPENPVCVQVVGRPKRQYDIATDNLAWHYWQFFGPIDYRPSGFGKFASNPY